MRRLSAMWQRWSRRRVFWSALVTICLFGGVIAAGWTAVAEEPASAGTDQAGPSRQESTPAKVGGHTGAVAEVATTPVDPTSLGRDWVRFEEDQDGEALGLQTAIVRYTRRPASSSSEPTIFVDLVSAVHVADRKYYQELNKRFEQYDALLYELVAPAGAVVAPEPHRPNAHPIGMLQDGMKSLLELEHQLDEIDYTKKNFVHADMSPEAFARSMQEVDGGFIQMFLKIMGQSMAQQSRMKAKGESFERDLFAALFADDRARALKVALAKQLAEIETLMAGFGGDKGTTLISERNKVAMGVLREQLAKGNRKLGIFYGAGHLTDMDQRLRKEFGMQPVSVTWITAWDLAEDR